MESDDMLMMLYIFCPYKSAANGWCFGWPPGAGYPHTLKRMLQVSRYQHVGKHVCLTAWIQASFIMTMLRLSLLSNILCGSSDWKNQLNVECFPPPIVCYLKPCGRFLGFPYHKTHVVGNPTCSQHSLADPNEKKNHARSGFNKSLSRGCSLRIVINSSRPISQTIPRFPSENGKRRDWVKEKHPVGEEGSLNSLSIISLTTKTGCKPPLCSQKSH